MEKLLTTEERIKRAEEIYARRKSQQEKIYTATVNVNEKKNFRLFKKLVVQILICSFIYYLLFWSQSTSYFISQDNKERIRQILSYDINFQRIYEGVQSKIIDLKNKNKNEVQEETNQQDHKKENNEMLQEATLSATEDGSEENIELTQMEEDAKQIKENYNLLKPIEGQISSKFGQRESNSSIISNNHAGIDIVAQEGKKIKAAMEGEVTIAMQSNSYRKLY